MKRNVIYLIIGIIIVMTVFGAVIINKEMVVNKNNYNNNNQVIKDDIEEFDYQFIRLVNKKNNYLVSPYSVKVALKLLEAGSDGKTKDEISKVLGNFNYTDLNIKNKVNVSNAVFIKNKYKDIVRDTYLKELSDRYKSQVLLDEFKSPDVINNWVNETTNGMIPSILDKMDPDFVMGLANALAIDVEWANQFDCSLTREEDFNKVDGSKMKTEMMHKSYEYNAKYMEDDEAKGIIIPYERYNRETGEKDIVGTSLEFVGIIPNDIDQYMEEFNDEVLSKLEKTTKDASNNYHINMSLPRFSYSYSLDNFMDILKSMGIEEAFDSNNANFSKMVDLDRIENNLYVGEAIHKTKIELNEKGTKAAAVTYFGMYANGMIVRDYEEVDIKFDKPFIYMIRDSKSKEILFFGVVYEPNKWNGSTCSED